ncbi:MAG: NADH-quinone oxidoreductase subunit C, partial [Paramuribaculum sp.]|nr:NADH-quinone oxidoreductase subunit C [Paramuribaculum sp.]
MAELKDTIARIFPEATFEDGDILTVNIPDAKWHEFAKTLRDNPEFGFDFLVTIVGMDWKDKLGCVYYLTSTKTNRHISVKVTTDNLEKPMLHSVADLWHIAGIFEREVYD